MAAGDITKDLAAQLAVRLEDEEEREFDAATKYEAIWYSELELASMLNDKYLGDLEDIDEAVDCSSGSILFSVLNAGGGVLKSAESIKKVKVYVGGTGDGLWSIEIDLDSINKTQNSRQTYSDTRIMHHIFKEQIFVLMTTLTASTADVYYLKQPVETDASTDPDFSTAWHTLILDLAEARLWRRNKEFDRAKTVLDFATNQIAVLNQKYQPAENIGTQSRNQRGGQI